MPALRKAGGELLVITPQIKQHSAKLKEEHGLDFAILWDESHQIAEELGLAFTFPDDLAEVYAELGAKLPEINGSVGYRLPMPARYLVDRDGLIRDAEVHPDYTKRSDPEEMVGSLEMLN